MFENYEVFGGSYRRNWQKNRRNYHFYTDVLWLLYPSPEAAFAHLSSILSVLQWTEKIWSIRHQAAAVMIGGWGPVQNRRFLYSWLWRVRSQILCFRPCQAQILSPFWKIMNHSAVISAENWKQKPPKIRFWFTVCFSSSSWHPN